MILTVLEVDKNSEWQRFARMQKLLGEKNRTVTEVYDQDDKVWIAAFTHHYVNAFAGSMFFGVGSLALILYVSGIAFNWWMLIPGFFFCGAILQSATFWYLLSRYYLWANGHRGSVRRVSMKEMLWYLKNKDDVKTIDATNN